MKKPSSLILSVMLVCIHASGLAANSYPSYFYSPSPPGEIKSNLYSVEADASIILMDGDLTQYDPSFSNTVDGMDAPKMSNFTENLGMARGTATLVIERRHTIEVSDTIFYKMWNVQRRLYRLEFITSNLNHPGLTGFLEDSYLHSSVPVDLDGSTYINFSVNTDSASSAMYRFRIIFITAAAATLPLTFTSVKAWLQNSAINVDWTTGNERNVRLYTIEKSTDGLHFGSVSAITAGKFPVNNYSWTDAYPAGGYNYYRIRSTGVSDEIKYSEVLKVFNRKGKTEIKVFPNPVTGSTIYLQLVNQPAGLYQVTLVNSSGQPVMRTQIQHAGGTGTETIRSSQHVPKGIYQLEVTKTGRSKINIQLVY